MKKNATGEVTYTSEEMNRASHECVENIRNMLNIEIEANNPFRDPETDPNNPFRDPETDPNNPFRDPASP
jgi:hypothetical protein